MGSSVVVIQQTEIRRQRDRAKCLIPHRKRFALIVQMGSRCDYCGGQGDYRNGPDGTVWNLDHMTPISRGGDPGLDNATLACGPCNRYKAARTTDELLAHLADADVIGQGVAMRAHMVETDEWSA